MTTTPKAHCCPADMRSACVSLRLLTREWERGELVSGLTGRQEKWECECKLEI